jgi:hypothetical protein
MSTLKLNNLLELNMISLKMHFGALIIAVGVVCGLVVLIQSDTLYVIPALACVGLGVGLLVSDYYEDVSL